MSPQARAKTTTWMGKVPSHWDVKALKYCADLVTDRVNGSEVDFQYVGLEHIESKTGRLIREDGSQENAESTVNCFFRDDVLFGKLRPYLAKAAVAESNGVCSSEILVYRPHGLTPQYLKHVMLLDGFIEEVNASTYGSKMPRADAAFISRLPVPQPPTDEQIAITAYLDAETKRIDWLIEEKKGLLHTLDQLFNSVITETVTRGLIFDVPRRSEPEHSLFDFPSHWIRCGLIKKIENIVDYRGKTPEKTDSGVFLVTARNIADGWIDYSASAEFIAESAYEEVMSRGKPEIGDVLFTTEAPLGKVASIDRTDIALAQRVIKFRADAQYLDNHFLKYWLMSGYMQEQLRTWSSGSTAEGIKASRLRRLQILVPPLKEQLEIVKFIEKKLIEVRELRAHVENDLLLLDEYRASTITDAVLGRIDVRKSQTH